MLKIMNRYEIKVIYESGKNDTFIIVDSNSSKAVDYVMNQIVTDIKEVCVGSVSLQNRYDFSALESKAVVKYRYNDQLIDLDYAKDLDKTMFAYNKVNEVDDGELEIFAKNLEQKEYLEREAKQNFVELPCKMDIYQNGNLVRSEIYDSVEDAKVHAEYKIKTECVDDNYIVKHNLKSHGPLITYKYDNVWIKLSILEE